MSCSVDESKWPIVVLKFKASMDAEDTKRYLADLDKLIAKQKRFALIFDLTEASAVPPDDLEAMKKWSAASQAQLKQACVGAGFVMDSPPTAGAYNIIVHHQPLPFPFKAHYSVDAAHRWLKDQFGKNLTS